MTHDRNGNRQTVTYPGGFVATYGFDFADRASSVSVTPAGSSAQTIVAAASYRASGLARAVTLGNGLVETREHDGRDHPTSIRVAGLLDWTYATDAVGNPTSIVDGLSASNDRNYAYQDVQYHLTQGDGPWGTRSWSYDRLGNRLSEVRDGGAADVYGYLMNAAGGNSPQMREIQRGASALVTFGYDAAGAQDQIDVDGAALDRPYDDAGRLARQSFGAGAQPTTFRYDGRGYLAEAVGQVPDTSGDALFCDGFESATVASWSGTGGGCTVPVVTRPTYSSEGVVYSLANGDGMRRHVIYLDDRPVAIVEESSGTSSVLWLTVDHLNTPVLATDVAGTAVWSGGFAPFGDDYADAQSAGVFLRFPGQWVDAAWSGGDGSTELAYNVHRWCQLGTGGYARVDPRWRSPEEGVVGNPFVDAESLQHLYSYAEGNPISWIDSLGLRARVCCRKIPGVGVLGFRHCYIQTEDIYSGRRTTCGLVGGRFSRLPGKGMIYRDNAFDNGGDCGEWNESCEVDDCVVQTAWNYPNPSNYNAVIGPNSNTFAGTIARSCSIKPPSVIGRRTPGWNQAPATSEPGEFQRPSLCFSP
ncbi:MAG: hypothetical protein AAF772_04760 [Acidobacteriota bacterium]